MLEINAVRNFSGTLALALLFLVTGPAFAADPTDRPLDYKILATSRTSTMEAELNRAAGEGYRFSKAMGGKSANGGQEIIVAMVKDNAAPVQGARKYRLLATSRTSTMQKELQQAADDGYAYLEQTVFETAFGGNEVVVIMEYDPARTDRQASYRLLATTSTSTMQRELKEEGRRGYTLLGLTVGKTAMGGDEVVAILKKD